MPDDGFGKICVFGRYFLELTEEADAQNINKKEKRRFLLKRPKAEEVQDNGSDL